MKMTRSTWMVLPLLLVLSACGEDKKDDNGGGSGAGAGTTGAVAGTTGSAAGTTGGVAGSTSCPADPGITMCGGAACPPIGALAMACVQNCCTTDGKCGTLNAAAGSACMAAAVNDTLCPNETILGNMATGCCVPNTNQCGVVDTLTGSGSCIARESVPLASLASANCDGTTPTGTAGAGGAGTGGTAGVGTAGTGG